MVAPRFAPYAGGTETHVAEVSSRLAAQGYSVEVLTTDPRHDLARREEMDGVSVLRYPTFPRGGDHYFAPGVARRLSRTRYDLVHVQGSHSLLAPLAMLAARTRGIPYVVTFHTGGHPSGLRRRLRGVQWRAISPLLRGACSLVAVSEFERHLFGRALGMPMYRINLVPNGAEMPRLAPVAERADLVVSVGRLEWYKGHHRAIDALPALARRRPDARLRIIGDGPIRGALLERAAELGVADRVSIEAVAPGNRAEMAQRVAEAPLLVLLSEYEAHPVAVAEALSLGRRVLVADTSGLSEIAAAGHASSVPLDLAPDALAAAIDLALSQPAPESGRSLPSWDDCAKRLADIYSSAGCARVMGGDAAQVEAES